MLETPATEVVTGTTTRLLEVDGLEGIGTTADEEPAALIAELMIAEVLVVGRTVEALLAIKDIDVDDDTELDTGPDDDDSGMYADGGVYSDGGVYAGGGLYSGGGDPEEITRPEEVKAIDDMLNRIGDEEGDLVELVEIRLILETTTDVVLNCAVEARP